MDFDPEANVKCRFCRNGKIRAHLECDREHRRRIANRICTRCGKSGTPLFSIRCNNCDGSTPYAGYGRRSGPATLR